MVCEHKNVKKFLFKSLEFMDIFMLTNRFFGVQWNCIPECGIITFGMPYDL